MRHIFFIIVLLVTVVFKDGHQEEYEKCWLNTNGNINPLIVTCGKNRKFGTYRDFKYIPLFDIEELVES